MKIAQPLLTLTGIVHSSKVLLPSVGDVAIHPGAGRTSYIDATIFDGSSWRALDLNGFGVMSGERTFERSDVIGLKMRRIKEKIEARRGGVVRYEAPASGSKRKYVYRGASIASMFRRY